jgi:O-antigen ligase
MVDMRSEAHPTDLGLASPQPRHGRATLAYGAFLAFIISVFCSLPQLVPVTADFSPAKILMAFAIAGLVKARVLDDRPLRFGLRSGGWAVWLLFLITVVSPCWSVDPEVTNTTVGEAVKYGVAFWLAVNVVDSDPRLRQTISLIALAALFPAIGAIKSYLAGDVVDGRAVWLGPFANSNFLAYHLVVGAALGLAARDLVSRTDSWPRLKRYAWLAVVLILASGVLVTKSRGGFLGLGAVFVVWLARNLLQGRLALGVICSVAVAIALAPGGPWERADAQSNLAGQVDVSAQGRIDAWRTGLRMIESHPTLGVGAGAFVAAYEQYAPGDAGPARTAHNSFLMVGAELGVPALLFFLTAVLAAVWSCGRLARSGPPARRAVAAGVQAALLGFGVCSFTAGLALTWPLYFLLGLGVAMTLLPPGRLAVPQTSTGYGHASGQP